MWLGLGYLCTELTYHLNHREIIKIFLFLKIFRPKGINAEGNTQSQTDTSSF